MNATLFGELHSSTNLNPPLQAHCSPPAAHQPPRPPLHRGAPLHDPPRRPHRRPEPAAAPPPPARHCLFLFLSLSLSWALSIPPSLFFKFSLLTFESKEHGWECKCPVWRPWTRLSFGTWSWKLLLGRQILQRHRPYTGIRVWGVLTPHGPRPDSQRGCRDEPHSRIRPNRRLVAGRRRAGGGHSQAQH